MDNAIIKLQYPNFSNDWNSSMQLLQLAVFKIWAWTRLSSLTSSSNTTPNAGNSSDTSPIVHYPGFILQHCTLLCQPASEEQADVAPPAAIRSASNPTDTVSISCLPLDSIPPSRKISYACWSQRMNYSPVTPARAADPSNCLTRVVAAVLQCRSY